MHTLKRKEYMKEHSKRYYLKNKDHLKRTHQEWCNKNKGYYKEYSKKYRQENRDKIEKYRQDNKVEIRKNTSEYKRKRRELDFRLRLDNNISNAVRRSLNGKKNGRKWETLLGYTIKDLIKHLEKQFDDKMNWNNRGKYWHIDHIKPISLFKYETAEELEFKECWALENLQPLEAKENIRKSNKFQPHWRIARRG